METAVSTEYVGVPIENATDGTLRSLIAKYKAGRVPLEVDFRELVGGLANPDRATHLVHPYPAKLLMHIPHFFLSSTLLSAPGDTVCDPFCGSGTVLLESILAGRSAIGCDTNPVATMISRVKTTRLAADQLRGEYARLCERKPVKPGLPPPDVVNIHKWFHPRVIKELCCLLEAIREIKNTQIREFFLICFSNSARRVSLADPRISVPVMLRDDKYPKEHRLHEKTKRHLAQLKRIKVCDVFSEVVESNIRRMAAFERFGAKDVKATVTCIDARNAVGECIPPASIQLVITSPPYAGAQKYIRASSLSLGWLGMCKASELKAYDGATIGREQFRMSTYRELTSTSMDEADGLLAELFSKNPLRAHIAGTYLLEMKLALKTTAEAVRPGGYVVLIVGNNQICGREFNSTRFLGEMMQGLGFVLLLAMVDKIRSRGLMTKRNKTAGVIHSESVLLFQKDGGTSGGS